MNALRKVKLNKKGFTLAELLIVIAIIAILVAIAIPVFTGQLNKAKAGTDLANLRSAYAVAQTTLLTNPKATANEITTAINTALPNVRAQYSPKSDDAENKIKFTPSATFETDKIIKETDFSIAGTTYTALKDIAEKGTTT